MSTAVAPDSPQVVHSFAKNTREEVRAQRTVYRGEDFLDLRVYVRTDDGWIPTKKGLTVRPEQHAELLAAVAALGGVAAPTSAASHSPA
jgi:hypothetical protein